MKRARVCPRCHEANKPSARFCCRCGDPLSAELTEADRPGLFLHEELLLLALDDEQGKIASAASGSYHYALAGGILGELLLAGRIEVEPGRKKLVTARVARPLHEPLLDEALEMIEAAARRRKLSDWVSKLAGWKNLKDRVATLLCRRGILEEVAGRLLFVFPTKRYPMRDPTAEYDAIERIQLAIFGDEPEVDERTALLVALADAGNLLGIRFAKAELRRRKARIRQLGEVSAVSQAAREAIEAVQAAVVAAAAAGAAVAAATS